MSEEELAVYWFHYGHANAIRRAKKLNPNVKLVVGVHTDEMITHNKGPPVMNDEERYAAVRACRWADVVVEGAPYMTEVDILRAHGCHYCIHGEDVSLTADGQNAYQYIIDAGMYKTIPRTRGVSTTNLVNRLLDAGLSLVRDAAELKRRYSLTQRNPIELDADRSFFPSALRVREFADDLVPPTADDEIVYVDGSFDLFHMGHIEFLKKAKALGTYLVVGLFDDDTVTYLKGDKFPLLSLHERALSVLACRYVDDVIIGAPFAITEQMIRCYSISKVAVGSTFDLPAIARLKQVEPYEVPRRLGILEEVVSPRPDITITSILTRIGENVDRYLARQSGRASENEIFEDIEARLGETEEEEGGEDEES